MNSKPTTEPKWEPRPSDLDWGRAMLATIRDGGVWGIPMSEQVYTFHHQLKEIWLMLGPNTIIANDLHNKNIILFTMLGYTVFDKRSPAKPDRAAGVVTVHPYQGNQDAHS